MLLWCSLYHLCWLPGCNWVLIAVGSFFGESFPPAGWLRVLLLTTSCVLLYRYKQVVLNLIFCLSEVIILLSHYCSVVCSGRFLHNLVVIPDLSWEVSVASIHSSTILPSPKILSSYITKHLCPCSSHCQNTRINDIVLDQRMTQS